MEIAGVVLRWKRAVGAFLIAYVGITILGTALSFAIAAVRHTPSTSEPLQNQAYLLSEPFLPFLNLAVWIAGGWIYFRGFNQKQVTRKASIVLGLFWLAIALPLDFVAFVAIKTPISLNPYDFYVGQFPWIYLIYVAVFVGPLCYLQMLHSFSRGRAI